MKYSKAHTILYYLNGSDPVISLIKDLAQEHALTLYKAEAISDVLAVPYILAIIDARFLGDRFYQFMRDPDYIELFSGEKLVLSGNTSQIPKDVRKHFIIPGKITQELLSGLLLTEEAYF